MQKPFLACVLLGNQLTDLVLCHLICWIQRVCLSLFALTVLLVSLLFKNMFYFEIGAHMVQANLESTMTLNL